MVNNCSRNDIFRKTIVIFMTVLLVFGVMFAFAPSAEAAPNIQSNVSTKAVSCNLSNGSLPANESVLTGGKTYYINLSATVSNKFKESQLYLQNPGQSGFSCVYDYKSKGFHRYTSFRYTAPSTSGSMNYYWRVKDYNTGRWSKYKVNTRSIQGTAQTSSSGPSRVTPFSSTKTAVLVPFLNTSKALDADNAGANAGNGTRIHLWDRSNGVTQIFDIVPKGSGWYAIIHRASGKALDVTGGVAGNGVKLQLYQQNDSNAQRFEFYDAGNGYYYIRNALGYMVDLYDGHTDNDTDILTWRFHGGRNQKWGIILVNVSNEEKQNNSGESAGNNYSDKITSFIADKRWAPGTYWGTYNPPKKGTKLSSQKCWQCKAYAADFVKYVFDINSIEKAKSTFTSLKGIKAGDVLHVKSRYYNAKTRKISYGGDKNHLHWLIVASVNGDKVTVYEANVGSGHTAVKRVYTLTYDSRFKCNILKYSFGSSYNAYPLSKGYHYY